MLGADVFLRQRVQRTQETKVMQEIRTTQAESPTGPSRSEASIGIDARTLSAVLEPGSTLDLAQTRNATETLREILDFDELAHEAETRRQGPRVPQEIRLPTSALPRFLKEDATPREARLLTGALSLLGEWCVVIPASPGSDGQSGRQGILFRFVSGGCS